VVTIATLLWIISLKIRGYRLKDRKNAGVAAQVNSLPPGKRGTVCTREKTWKTRREKHRGCSGCGQPVEFKGYLNWFCAAKILLNIRLAKYLLDFFNFFL
jgi:hypothetical protein